MRQQFSISKLRNRESVVITDQATPTVIPKSYQHTSQMSDLLHPLTNSTRNSTFQMTQYRNPITQQSVSLRVPKDKDPDSIQRGLQNRVTHEHQNWLEMNKKFSKPYSDCTKYIDNLSQHKALIRRGPFDMPAFKKVESQATCDGRNSRSETENCSRRYLVSNNMSRLKSASYTANQNSQFQYKPVFRTKKNIIFQSLEKLRSQSIENKLMASNLINNFDRSLKNNAINYELLMKKDRNLKSDSVVLKNSLNKLVDVDMIMQKLEEGSLLAKNNLRKIQQKFKRKHQIKFHSQN